MAYTDAISGYFSDFDWGATVSVVTFAVILFIVAIIFAVILFIVLTATKYNKKLVIFQKVGKTIEVVKRDRAMVVKFGEAGDTIFFVKKSKKYLPDPSIQTGRNTYWYYIREDGEWINFGIEDIDEKFKELKIHYLDKEMRYARTQIQRNLKERYDQPNFWTKYGGLIAYIGLVAMTGIMMWLLFDKFLDIASSVNVAIDKAAEVQETTKQIIGGLDGLKATGSIQPAP